MLLELRVKNLGIIEDLEWKLDEGLNVITGETGAGKSLIIDAIELLLTGTSNEDFIRYGSDEARIEGVFTLDDNTRFEVLKNLLTEKNLLSEDGILILSCNIRRGKPAIVKINETTSNKTTFRQVGQLLIDIYGQSEHSSLLNIDNHLDFLDSYAHILELRSEYGIKATRLSQLESELNMLTRKNLDSVRQEEFLRYQIDEINKANLHQGEEDALENERKKVLFSEKLKEYAGQIYEALYENESARHSGSALAGLNEAFRSLKKLVDLDPYLKDHLDFLDKTIAGVEEIARDIRAYKEKLEESPGRLDEIEARLELINNLRRKYGKTISEILAYKERAISDLNEIQNIEDKVVNLKLQIENIKKEMGLTALTLSRLRSQAAENLKIGIKRELEELDMSQMQFDVSINRIQSPEGIGGSEGYFRFNNKGIDNVEFTVSTNPGEPVKPLAKISSTGEISRFTLALKGTLSETDHTPILIFDEIDTGIGGRNGEIIGKKLWNLARNHQVICVTHLPQIAVYADKHYHVKKCTINNRTTSSLEKLTGDLRLNEIAAMIAGRDFSTTTLKNAQELINKAETWKKIIAQDRPASSAQLRF